MALLLPLRASGTLPAGELDPLNCLYGGGDPANGRLRPLTSADLAAVEIASDAVWPSVRVTRSGNTAESGPTGAPWVNANGWRIRARQFRAPGKAVWLDTKPAQTAPPASQVLAVAEAMAYGGAWIVEYAEATWPAVQKALRFFAGRSEWTGWQPVANLSIVGVFNEFFEGEYLNLAMRRQIGFQLIRPGAIPETPALVWLSTAAIPFERLLPWIRSGGTLLAPAGTAARAEGKGRILAPEKPWTDPYAAVAESHLSISRKLDVLRLWNGGSLNAHYVAEAGGKRAVVHLINYAVRAASNDISVWLARPWTKAVLTDFDKQTPLKPVPRNGGCEIALPPISVYAAIELEA